VAMAQRVPESLAGEDSEEQQIKRLALAMSPEEVQLDYQIALQARNDMALAPDEYAGFTMAILRMLAFKPAGSRVGLGVPEKTAPAAAVPASRPQASPAAVRAMQQAPRQAAEPVVNEPQETLVKEPSPEELDALAGDAPPPWDEPRGEQGAS